MSYRVPEKWLESAISKASLNQSLTRSDPATSIGFPSFIRRGRFDLIADSSKSEALALKSVSQISQEYFLLECIPVADSMASPCRFSASIEMTLGRLLVKTVVFPVPRIPAICVNCCMRSWGVENNILAS